MVWLKDEKCRIRNLATVYFNSNMVWLKVECRSFHPEVPFAFQFQYGLIKSLISAKKLNRKYIFQFQYGLIKRQDGLDWLEDRQRNFNSNMVWLKALLKDKPNPYLSRFQFQYGLIKSQALIVISPVKSVFQFQYGLIKRQRTGRKYKRGKKISIPIWFD